jgi:competence protein ComGC
VSIRVRIGETIHPGEGGKMQKRNGLTLVDIIVVIFIVLILLAILAHLRIKSLRTARRVVCATNVKGLGSALTVYANDYNGRFPQLPGKGTWSKRLGFD